MKNNKINKAIDFSHIIENEKKLSLKNDNSNFKKRNFSLTLNKTAFDEFLKFGHSIFYQNRSLYLFSNSYFLKFIALNLRDKFVNDYGKLSTLSPNDLRLLKKVGNRKKILKNLYPYSFDKENLIKTSFSIEEPFFNLLYVLANTFYKNNRDDEPNYSLVMFFYDLIALLPNMKIVFYSEEQIKDFVKNYEISE